MKALFISLASFNFCLLAIGQSNELAPLFQDDKPISIKLSFSIKDVKKITNDSVYTATQLGYKNDQGNWDSLKADVRARGKFRRKNCSLPPIRIKLKKGDTEGTLFTGNNNLKLVLPCESTGTHNDLVVKEFLCYQLYEAITPFIFNTRLVNVSLTDLGSRSRKTHELKGILIEDDDLISKRFNANVVESVKLHPALLHDTSSVVQAFFEYMIANTDWSATAQHNVKLFLLTKRKYVPIAYDFDMAGLVNAPYSTINETLEITTVRERLYRGFCKDEAIMRYVQSEYIRLEPQIMAVVDRFKNDLGPKELVAIKKYLSEFFVILKNERAFKNNILSKCRML